MALSDKHIIESDKWPSKLMHPSVPHYKFRQFTFRGDHQEPAEKKDILWKQKPFSSSFSKEKV